MPSARIQTFPQRARQGRFQSPSRKRACAMIASSYERAVAGQGQGRQSYRGATVGNGNDVLSSTDAPTHGNRLAPAAGASTGVLAKSERAWQREGWLPALFAYVLVVVGIALQGALAALSGVALEDRAIGETIWTITVAYGVGAFDALADAGLFLTPATPWLTQALIGLVVAVVAVPALRDIASRREDDGAARVESIARKALALTSDSEAATLRKQIPGMTTELALRRVAGIAGQLIACVAAVVLTTSVALLIRGQWRTTDESALPDAAATVMVMPILIAIAVVAGLYRVDPVRARLRRLVAFLLDERATRHVAAAYVPGWTARRSGWVLIAFRVGAPVLISLALILGAVASVAAQNEMRWGEVVQSPISFVLAWLLILVPIALVYVLVDGIASGVVWARYWLGRPTWVFTAIVLGALWIALTVSFSLMVIAPTLTRGDWGFGVVFILLLALPTLAMALPLAVKWRPWLFLVPGYAQLPRIEAARAKLIDTYTEELTARVAGLDAAANADWRSRLRALIGAVGLNL